MLYYGYIYDISFIIWFLKLNINCVQSQCQRPPSPLPMRNVGCTPVEVYV
jgi:hypothetical protein